jgi:hypothetical protein
MNRHTERIYTLNLYKDQYLLFSFKLLDFGGGYLIMLYLVHDRLYKDELEITGK